MSLKKRIKKIRKVHKLFFGKGSAALCASRHEKCLAVSGIWKNVTCKNCLKYKR